MARLLVFFLDGVGLGADDPAVNPLAAAAMPYLEGLLDGRRLLQRAAPIETDRATLLGVDARLGIDGAPQSASGQAALLTGLNIPRMIGGHYGPKPNQAIRSILQENNLFMDTLRRGNTATLINAYPPQYFEAISNGRRIHGCIPYAVSAAGIPLRTAEELQARRALSADLTGAGWAARQDFPPAPVHTPSEAGRLMAEIAASHDLAWFDYWPTDIAGHRGSMAQAVELLGVIDAVLGGLLAGWDVERDLILLTSDHGNLEDLSKRGHTLNPIPAVLIGPLKLRRLFAENLNALPDMASSVLRSLPPDGARPLDQ